MRKIIIISGKARHGKDTFASLLKEQLMSDGYKVAMMAYAKYLKMYMRDFYGWDGETKDDVWRSKIQYLGTDKIRNQLNKPNFHVNRVIEDIQVVGDDFDYIIITDARFENEIFCVKEAFPSKVLTTRVIRENFESHLSEEQKAHPSETALDDFSFNCEIKADCIEKLESYAQVLSMLLGGVLSESN